MKSSVSITLLLLSLRAKAMEMDPDMGDDDMGMDMMMMMPMSFWKGNQLNWLFYELESTTGGQYCGGLIVTFILGFALEALTYLRNFVYIKAQIKSIRNTQYLNRDVPRILVDLRCSDRLLLTLLYVSMLLIAYSVMLLVMTFNYPILLMLCGGIWLGHLGFDIIGLPELPIGYRQIAGSGAYLPESDNCCNKICEECPECPSTQKSGCPSTSNGGYKTVNTTDGEDHCGTRK